MIELPTLRCQRCGHTWHPRHTEPPLRCPKCGSPYWDKPRRQPAGAQEEKEMDTSECQSCLESGIHTPATTHSTNPDYAGYDLCEECAAEYNLDGELPLRQVARLPYRLQLALVDLLAYHTSIITGNIRYWTILARLPP